MINTDVTKVNIEDLHWGAAPASRTQDWSEFGRDEEWPDRFTFTEAFRFEASNDRTYTLITRDGAEPSHVLLAGELHELEVLLTEDLEESPFAENGITEDLVYEFQRAEPVMNGAEGPMMNYWYPIEATDRDVHEIAATVADLPLCVVEVDEQVGLALTGGGMDLTWEIAEGFVLLDYFPPAWIREFPWYNEPLTDAQRVVVSALIVRNERQMEILSRDNDDLHNRLNPQPR